MNEAAFELAWLTFVRKPFASFQGLAALSRGAVIGAECSEGRLGAHFAEYYTVRSLRGVIRARDCSDSRVCIRSIGTRRSMESQSDLF
jgi:hypothetical protein